jgi:hypothetical protein
MAWVAWGGAIAWRGRARVGEEPIRGTSPVGFLRTWVSTFIVILVFALPNLIPAARVALARVPKMALGEFVDLYVHLRHPHHYDPLSWPVALWVSFLWPVPLAWMAYGRGRGRVAVRRAMWACAFFCGLMAVALLFAGVWFVSEPLIQMSFFRFGIYPKLLTCVGGAAVLLSPAAGGRRRARVALLATPVVVAGAVIVIRAARPTSAAGAFVCANVGPLLLFAGVLAGAMAWVVFGGGGGAGRPRWPGVVAVVGVAVALAVGWNRWLGLNVALADDGDAAYREVCRFARERTPVGAVFLVPPNEQLFRYHGRRAIVVNFKNVPQLSSEMPEWRRRLEDVLGSPLATLPRRFDLAHAEIARRYDARPFDELAAVAKRYGARYVLTARPQAGRTAAFENESYHLYDLSDR